MNPQWLLRGTIVLAAIAIATADVAAQASSLEGTWVLDAERSENAQEMLATRMGGAGAMRTGDGAGAAAAVRGGGGGGGGRMIVRGGGQLVGSLVQAGQRVRIELGVASVTVRVDDDSPFTLPLTGEEIEVRRWEQAVLARARLANATLTIESTGENGIAFHEIFTATERDEIDAELSFTFPSMGGPQSIVAKRVYVKASEGAR
jgi:hypothetical protein